MEFDRKGRLALAAGVLACGMLLLPKPAVQAAEPAATAVPVAVDKSALKVPGLPPTLYRTHLLGPGDKIDVAVEDKGEYSRSVTVFADGTIDLPAIGTVPAAGLTVRELADRLTEAFKRELKRPSVQVTLLDVFMPPKAPDPVKVVPRFTALGAVQRKGEVEIPQPKMLRYVLAEIGPTTTADLASIRIRYPDGTSKTADFSDFALTGMSKDDLLIKGGEEIVLLERQSTVKADPIRIIVLGNGINKRGPITLDPGVSILEALDRAGGPAGGADLAKVKVENLSHKEPVFVNVQRIQEGDLSANYVVQQGDTIVVNNKPLKILLVGSVPRPGDIAVDDETTLTRLLFAAGTGGGGGGGNGGADLGKTEIIRRLPNNKLDRQKYDIREIEKQKRPDPKLQDGDVVFVPDKKNKGNIMSFLSNVLAPVWLIRGLAL